MPSSNKSKPVFVLPSKNKEFKDPVTGRMSVVNPVEEKLTPSKEEKKLTPEKVEDHGKDGSGE